jgi:molybdopterin-guanine dinucleotide biosynthesis protein A
MFTPTPGGSRTEREQAMDGCSGAILAGGESSRINSDKAYLLLGGRTLVEHLILRLRPLFGEILLVTRSLPSTLEQYADGGVRVVGDLLEGKGPLGGIYTALENSATPFSFVIGCDMPYPSLELIEYMYVRVKGHQAVVPRRGKYIEPLFSIYSRDLREGMRRFLLEGRLKVHEFLSDIDVVYVEEMEVRLYDPDGLSFFNINTPQELERAREIFSALASEEFEHH